MPTIELNQQAIEERVIEQAAEQIVESFCEGRLLDLQKRILERLEERIKQHCDDVVNPIIEKGIKEFTFNVTNRFGESQQPPQTLTEYLVGMAEEYLQHRVDFHGEAKDPKGYGYKDYQTRLTYLINKHLSFSIENVMKDAVQIVLKTVAPALAETAKIKINEVTQQLTKRA